MPESVWSVATERLSLRPYHPDDLDALWAFEQLVSESLPR